MPLDQTPVPPVPNGPHAGSTPEEPGQLTEPGGSEEPGESAAPTTGRVEAASGDVAHAVSGASPVGGRVAGWNVRVAGPWSHRDLAANGARFHITEQGEGPLVLLVHGWPQYWWAWRHQMAELAAAGFRAVALDLRGMGGSDRTPRGYDPTNLALDITGVIRSLGEHSAHLVGHDTGGALSWVAAVMRPSVIQSLTVISAAHPRHLRRALLKDRRQMAAYDHVLGFQQPWIPERRLVADDAAQVADFLNAWSGPNQLADEAIENYRKAIQIPSTAHCSIEPYRWLVRSMARPDGIQFARRMKKPVTAPTLHIQGAADPVLLARTALGAGEYVAAPYRWRLLPGVGHFPHEEVPQEVSAELLGWVSEHKR
ncbi:alpha/beta fold hydrolase [Kitasatospora kifunensis]|uniref:Pimeloyl-ACP methyl ester carboxylesterase n=1 Tax=Kitasatospora kifunensis TaxID=58351 RepID=A0A7W7R3I5_KITKI|nr:alpha/beta hydrolase [Kitasatospora kifunensis]MBB4924813.1 pimeloyl-ACP methyl ester carboxylesterase [Kitasatospora kifunensis]